MEAHKAKNEQQPLIEDDDLAFFISLLQMVKKLSIDEKYTFRMETMKYLQEMQRSKKTAAGPNNNSEYPRDFRNTDTSQSSSACSYPSYFSPNEQQKHPTIHHMQYRNTTPAPSTSQYPNVASFRDTNLTETLEVLSSAGSYFSEYSPNNDEEQEFTTMFSSNYPTK